MSRELLEGETTGPILDAFRTVHRTLGLGFRELIYGLAMERELIAMGCRVAREVAVMVYYRGEPLARQTLDMIVNDRVIVENQDRRTASSRGRRTAIQLSVLDRHRGGPRPTLWPKSRIP